MLLCSRLSKLIIARRWWPPLVSTKRTYSSLRAARTGGITIRVKPRLNHTWINYLNSYYILVLNSINRLYKPMVEKGELVLESGSPHSAKGRLGCMALEPQGRKCRFSERWDAINRFQTLLNPFPDWKNYVNKYFNFNTISLCIHSFKLIF